MRTKCSGTKEDEAPLSNIKVNESNYTRPVKPTNDNYFKIKINHFLPEYVENDLLNRFCVGYIFQSINFDGEEKSDLYINNPEPHLMVQIYKAKYEAVSKMKMVQDSVFTYDTIAVMGFKDSSNIVKTFKSVTQREEKQYDIIWDTDFINTLKNVIKPLYDAAQKDKVSMSLVITGIDKDKADALAKETGIGAEYFTADEKLVKTIMRSNPGIVLWQKGVLLQKWHYKKLPQWEDIKKQYLTK